MTATAKLFREVLADRDLAHSTSQEAREIVARAELAVERYKTELAQRSSESAADARPAGVLQRISSALRGRR